MAQTRRHSAIETTTHVVAGFTTGVLCQVALFPLFGVNISFFDNLSIATMMTAVGWVRGYVIRRGFDHYTGGDNEKERPRDHVGTRHTVLRGPWPFLQPMPAVFGSQKGGQPEEKVFERHHR